MAPSAARSSYVYELARLRRRVGFTTLEVLGALVISMILASIAYGAMQLYQDELPLIGSANRLAHAFSTARTLAIGRNSTFAVIIDRQYHNFWINETDALGVTIAAKVVSPETIDVRATIVGIQPVDKDVATVTLLFHPDGSSDDAAIYLKLKSKLASTLTKDETTVRLYGPTGSSRVFEHQQIASF